MIILFTDNKDKYDKSNSAYKVLIGNASIISTYGFNERAISVFNANLNGIENEAAEKMIQELKEVSQNCPEINVNPFLKTRINSYDIAYSLLYINFKYFIQKKYFLRLFIASFIESQNVKETFQLSFYLSESYYFGQFGDYFKTINCDFSFYVSQKSLKVNGFKNIMYWFYGGVVNFFRKTKIENKKHILLFIYDTFNDIDLFQSFVSEIKKSENIILSIVQLSGNISKAQQYKASVFENENIHAYKFEEFRTFVAFSNKDFYSKIAKQNSVFSIFKKYGLNDNLEIYYSFINNAIKKLKPDVVIYDNTGETGRAVSDVSRFYKIPSINVDYAMFSDDAIYMECNIKFTIRACISDATVDLWKKRNDKTPYLVPIGFLKLDTVDTTFYRKEEFLKKNNLAFGSVTIFFASTWGGTNDLYNNEKKDIVFLLAKLCENKKWNLIIKKHPSEKDNFIEEEIKNYNFKNIIVCNHNELNLYEAISYSDIICTQSSSISLEALYLNKPTVFFNLSQNKGFSDTSIMKNESFIYFVNSISDFEFITNKILNYSELDYKNISDKKNRYLYKTDGNAAKRLLHLALYSTYELPNLQSPN